MVDSIALGNMEIKRVATDGGSGKTIRSYLILVSWSFCIQDIVRRNRRGLAVENYHYEIVS
jgi:hypothetical protein